MTIRAALLATVLILAPLGVRATDLVVWWDKAYYPEEDQALAELTQAFEAKTGLKVEFVRHDDWDVPKALEAAIAAGRPPDFAFDIQQPQGQRWAAEDHLVDLTDVVGGLAGLFDPDLLDLATATDGRTGRRGLYALPVGRFTNHVHVWKDLLERAGFTLADVPKEWEPFWAFWCDKVQPAVRKATGREDVWGVGLDMAADANNDTDSQFWQFVSAYEADYVTRDGRLVIDEPEVWGRLVEALTAYAAIWRKGCTPPDALDWDSSGNNKAFWAQRVMMTPNPTLSIQNALKATRPEDYYKNAVTLDWPAGVDGQPLAIYAGLQEAVVFNAGGHVATAKGFVRFLVEDGWLAHWLDFAGDRLLPPMPALLDSPFWLDQSTPHRVRAAMQFLTRPRTYDYVAVSGEWRHARVRTEHVWSTAVHRVAADGLSPAQAVDEAIARVKQLLSE